MIETNGDEDLQIIQAMEKQFISIETKVSAPVEEVWKFWTTPKHITNWNNASADWYTPSAENDLREGGSFSYRMAARDNSASFNFTGIYDEVRENQLLVYTIEDGREVRVKFQEENGTTHVVEQFVPDATQANDVQKRGWQAILDNFKRYVEESL